MDKQALVDAIVLHFTQEYEVLLKAAQATYEAATHEENRAENKYDTRGLEASYLAESQSKRANEIRQTVNIYKSLKFRPFSDDDTVAMSALVVVDDGGTSITYFLGPRGGGTKVMFQGKEIIIITGASPLGQALMGSQLGDVVPFGPARDRRELEITELF